MNNKEWDEYVDAYIKRELEWALLKIAFKVIMVIFLITIVPIVLDISGVDTIPAYRVNESRFTIDTLVCK